MNEYSMTIDQVYRKSIEILSSTLRSLLPDQFLNKLEKFIPKALYLVEDVVMPDFSPGEVQLREFLLKMNSK